MRVAIMTPEGPAEIARHYEGTEAEFIAAVIRVSTLGGCVIAANWNSDTERIRWSEVPPTAWPGA